MEKVFKVITQNGKNGHRNRFLVPINATAPYSNDISTFLEDSDDYTADYYEGLGFHSSSNIFKTTTRKPPPPVTTNARDIFAEDNFFYQHVFNFSLVLIFLLQVLLIWLFLIRRKMRSRFEADLQAIQVQYHAGGGGGGGNPVVGFPNGGGQIGGFVTLPAPAA